MKFFAFLAEAVFQLHMVDFRRKDEGDDEEQNTGPEEDETLEKHKGEQSIS